MKQLISLGILALLSLPWDAQAETSAEPRTPLSPATMATVHGPIRRLGLLVRRIDTENDRALRFGPEKGPRKRRRFLRKVCGR